MRKALVSLCLMGSISVTHAQQLLSVTEISTPPLDTGQVGAFPVVAALSDAAIIQGINTVEDEINAMANAGQPSVNAFDGIKTKPSCK
ncbi:MAG: hypothetical protein ACREUA_06170 [Burkholderiales bacterium]